MYHAFEIELLFLWMTISLSYSTAYYYLKDGYIISEMTNEVQFILRLYTTSFLCGTH